MLQVKSSLIFLAFGGIFCLMGWVAQEAQAASGDADGTYTVTVTKVEISKDNGSTYTTLFDGSQAINIASASAGAVAASLATGVALAPGTYTTVRTTIGSTMQIKGYLNISGSTWYTNGGTDSNGFSVNAGVTNTPGSSYAIAIFTIPAANRTSTQSGFSIAVTTGGSASTTRIAFDTSGVITNSGGTPTIGPPSVTITSS